MKIIALDVLCTFAQVAILENGKSEMPVASSLNENTS